MHSRSSEFLFTSTILYIFTIYRNAIYFSK
nr:MAG TPA: hypothetical protein [Bacteriophage sp.]